MQVQPEAGVIEVTPKIGMLIWSWQQALLSTPMLEIGGRSHKAEWGKPQSFEVPPGRHRVTVYARPHIRPLVGEARETMRLCEGSADVSVEANKVTRVTYNYIKASMSGGTTAIGVEDAAPLPPAAASASGGRPAAAAAVAAAGVRSPGDLAQAGPDMAGLPSSPPAGAACATCGAGLPQGARFCQECGTPVSAPADVMTCPSCGNAQSSGRFCANCGTQMNG